MSILSKNIKSATLCTISNNFLLRKQEALVTRFFIDEILVDKLGFSKNQIINDTTFKDYTDSKRPDLLISEIEYNTKVKNDTDFIENLVAYAEVKDASIIDDSGWNEAKKKGKEKAKSLKMPFYIVTNTQISVFYNTKTGREIYLNNNTIREFQIIDIFRLIKGQLNKNPNLYNIITNANSISAISEAVFNKKLWDLAKIYRDVKFKSKIEKIDFTIGLIALAYYEEKQEIAGMKNRSKTYWSDCNKNNAKPREIVANLSDHITWLEQESQFGEFHNLMDKVKNNIQGSGTESPIVEEKNVKKIYNIINTMKPLHGTAFDLFGSIYEMFADSKEKKEFGEYFTRRHYAYILCKLLLETEEIFDADKKFKILDPACGTGGFLTEGFKILKNRFLNNVDVNNDRAKQFLENECFYGWDVRPENISRVKLNMFLVGDGHTNMILRNTLDESDSSDKFDYIITNPPYGQGTIKADSENILSKRTEIAFFFKIVKLLRNNGKGCIILPDGMLENPSFKKLREEILKECTITAIISLPKFAFAPYTKEKTYAVYFTKKTKKKIQKNSIWMYVIDNDGFANSDKRFPTKLRIDEGKWLHDEILGWVDTIGEEHDGILEQRWLRFDDVETNGTKWVNEKGINIKLRKGGNIKITTIQNDPYFRLLPEFYLRPYEPKFITIDELENQVDKIITEYNTGIHL